MSLLREFQSRSKLASSCSLDQSANSTLKTRSSLIPTEQKGFHEKRERLQQKLIERHHSYLLILSIVVAIISSRCPQQAEADISISQTQGRQSQVSISMILPQTFRVPTNELQGERNSLKLQQQVALVNNAQNDAEDEKLRQKYKKLTLQIRDAKTPIAGQLFYEHVFDYFPASNPKTLLIPVNLEQVSAASSYEPGTGSRVTNLILRPQQLIVSIRPYQLDSGFGSDSIEFASSAPIPVEAVPSYDGRHSFAVIQTDKPIYRPNEPVRIRSLVVNENLRPVTGDELRLQVRNPQRIIVEEVRFPISSEQVQSQNADNQSLFLDHVFRFPAEPMLGIWTIHLLHPDPIANDTSSFEVKEYVLPTFEVEFEPPKYILPSTQNITGAIIAKYHYGLPVQGKAYFKFGFKETANSKPRFLARSSIKNIDQTTGRVEFRMSSAKIQEMGWFPSIAFSKFLIEATVTETGTGHREVVQDSQCTFIPYPYYISFEDSIGDFKPGLSQQLSAQVIEVHTLRPAPKGSRIMAQYYDQNGTALISNNDKEHFQHLDTESITDQNGRVTFNVGPIRPEVNTIQVTLRWINSAKPVQFDQRGKPVNLEPGSEMAVAHHTLVKHDSSSGWISINNKLTNQLSVGDQFVSDINMQDALVKPQEVFYVILSRGNIIAIESVPPTEGLIKFTVTEQMIPSIRLVLFARSMTLSSSNSNNFIADSIRINVNSNSQNCGLNMRYKSDKHNSTGSAIRPNDSGKLLISARQGDIVSIVGVDSAIYTLNNRSRIDSFKIMNRVKRLDPGCGFGGGKSDLDVFHNAGLMLIKNFPTDSELEANQSPARLTSYLGSFCMSVINQMKHLEDIQLGYSRPIFSAAAAQYDRPRILDLTTSVRQRMLGSGNQGLFGMDPYALAATTGALRAPRRLKREVDIEALLKTHKDPLSKSCCRLGTLEDIPQRRNCSVRKRIVEKYMSHQFEALPNRCSQIYFECCRSVFGDHLALGAFFKANSRIGVEEMIVGRRLPTVESSRTRVSLSSELNIGHLDKIESETLVRKDFRETWLFELVEISDPNGAGSLDVKVPHSITSWSVSAMALNRFMPMCFMERALKINTFQEIFIQLSMPYKVVQGEQLDLVATIFNYSPQVQEVLVYMYGVEEICSEAEPNERSERKRIRIERFSSQGVLFPLIPLKTGKYPIKITAIAVSAIGGSQLSDSIERQLNVVQKGRTVTDETTFSLDPMNRQRRSKRAIQTGNLVDEIDSARGVQRSKVRLTPSRDAELIVPQSQECIVSAIGDRLGQSVQTSIVDVENLIRLPHGCGEQVMIYMGPTLYTTHYLTATDRLSGETRWKAIRYIQGGYKRILNYRKESGAFSAFARREPSIWLSAFVAKMLCQTERTPFIAQEVHVDKNVINSALEWLINEQDKDTGAWLEVNPVYHREMLGGVLKENALTAFIVLTFNECIHHSTDLVDEKELAPNTAQPNLDHPDEPLSSSLPHGGHSSGTDKLKVSLQKAEKMLLQEKYKATKEKNPYVMALTAYALSFNRARDSADIINDLMAICERSYSKNTIHWRGDYNIETAAYALQAIIELGPLANQYQGNSLLNNKIQPSPWQRGLDAISIANWLSSRRSFTGAFESTQDTVVALEALSKFAQLQATQNNNLLPPPTTSSSSLPSDAQANLVCNLTIANNNRTRRSLAFRNDNAQILQTFKMDSFDIDTVNGEMLDIVTSGNGLGTMSVKLKYNVFQEEDELCRFEISSSIEEWQPPKLFNMPNVKPEDQKLANLDLSDDHASSNGTLDDDDPFKPFDRSMLSELSVINPHADPLQEAASNPKPALKRPNQLLRLRRSPNRAMPDSIANDTSSRQQDTWTSKLVSSLRQNLASWIKPTMTSVTSKAPKSTLVANNDTPELKKTNTSRRSTGWSPAPLIVYPASSLPANSHMNPLSNETLNYNSTTNIYDQMQATQPYSSGLAVNKNVKLVLLLKTCVNYLSNRRDSEMAVIEIGILSGFKPNEADLAEITKEIGGLAMHIELSADKSMVIIYMKYIPFSGPYCVQFRLIRDTMVYNLQSGYIRAYEYYSPAHSCSNIYTPSRVSNLLETRCDSSGQVCECAAKSLCPATHKLLELGEIHSVNATRARGQVSDLVCSKKYDLISFVKLKSVRYFKSAKMFKLSVRVKSDLRGNLTKIIEAQRRQKFQSVNTIRKPSLAAQLASSNGSLDLNSNSNSDEADQEDINDGLLDNLSLMIEANCVYDDHLLLHLAHPNQWKHGGDMMILFARYTNLEKRFLKVTSAKNSQRPASQLPATQPPQQFPRPKAHILSSLGMATEESQEQQDLVSLFEDAQQLQYSINLKLDRESILHDLAYESKVEPRESINNLLLWLELHSRRERWSCPTVEAS